MDVSRRSFLFARNVVRSAGSIRSKLQLTRQRSSLKSGLTRIYPLRNVHGSTFVKRVAAITVGLTGGLFIVQAFDEFRMRKIANSFVSCCQEANSHSLPPPSYESSDISDEARNGEAKGGFKVKLFQYQNCPFCCKVRAFLDYYGIEYEKVEVNPLLKKEIKFSEYRKVPIVIVDGSQQLNDSSLIISILRSYMLGKGSLESLLVYYPKIEVGEGRSKKTEYQNRHNVMYMEAMPTKEKANAVREELKWRKWVDDTLVHMLSPNIYRTMGEAYQAFDYFASVGNFGAVERFFAINCGAIFMYGVSKRLKKRYNLKDDVRQSLYEEVNNWVKAIGKRRNFLGGDMPNLADLGVYGVLNAIEGLDAFEDMMKNTNIKPWYTRMQKAVLSQQGRKEYESLIDNLA